MERNIFRVEAWIVDANGTFNVLTGYPKNFDSRSYDGDVNKALRRAQGDFSEVFGAFCKRDDRQLQTVILTQANGQMIDRKTIGTLVDPDTEPEPEPEPEDDGEGEGEGE